MMESAPARDQSDPTQSPFAVGHDIARMLAGEGMHGAANGDLLCLGQFLLRVSRFRDIKHIEMEQLMRGICPLDQRHNGSFDVARTSAHGRASVPQAKQHLNPRPHRHGVEPHARADARRFVAAGGTGSCGGDGGAVVIMICVLLRTRSAAPPVFPVQESEVVVAQPLVSRSFAHPVGYTRP